MVIILMIIKDVFHHRHCSHTNKPKHKSEVVKIHYIFQCRQAANSNDEIQIINRLVSSTTKCHNTGFKAVKKFLRYHIEKD